MICKTSSRTWTKCVCSLCFATSEFGFVIICDSNVLYVSAELLVKCNVWCVMLNDAILVVIELVWNPSWFRLTTGIIWAQVQKFRRFDACCFCTCALIIWTVLLQLVLEQNSTLNTSYMYLKTKAFVCKNHFPTYKNIQVLKIWNYFYSMPVIISLSPNKDS
jgi:hypothetical protein